MFISSVKAYQLGSVTMVAPLLALTSIINAIVEFIFKKNKKKLIQKLIAAILLILGVILVKL
jgi:drug/metabolite transporter (DMT)-like permease